MPQRALWIQSAVILIVLSVLPLNAATWPAASPSSTDIAAAIALASNGDTITVPAGSATYSSPLSWNKWLIIQGAGSNLTTIVCNMATGGGDPSTMSCFINFPGTGLPRITGIGFKGLASPIGGTGIYGGSNLRVDNCLFDSLDFGIYSLGATNICIDHSIFINCHPGVRCYGSGIGDTDWFTYYPIPFTSQNYLCVEYCTFAWNSSFWRPGAGAVCVSSGQGSRYIARFCTLQSSSEQFSPAFDWHGDNGDGTHGNISSLIYCNNVVITGTGSIDKFCDARGGQAYIYSNNVTGTAGGNRGVAVSEEHPLDFPNDPAPHDWVTNTWVWQNYVNGTLMAVNNTFDPGNLLILGTHYRTNDLSATPPAVLIVPHPLDQQSGGGGGPNTNVMWTTGASTAGAPSR